jgi:hypothetical protein
LSIAYPQSPESDSIAITTSVFGADKIKKARLSDQAFARSRNTGSPTYSSTDFPNYVLDICVKAVRLP